MTQSIEQFDRYAKLLIKSDNVTLDLSNLAFRFETSIQLIASPKTLKVKVYNVAPRTLQIILQEGLQIELIAGYSQSYSTIFSGQIRQVSIGKENGTDTFVDIQATDNDLLFRDGFISTTISAGSTNTQRLRQVHGILNTPEQELLINSTDPGTQLPRGKVFHGKAVNYFDSTAAQLGSSYHVENNKLIINDINKYTSDEKVIIDRSTGMIGLPQQTIQGIQVKCLLNPNIKLGAGILLDNNSIQIKQQAFGVSEEPKWELNTNPLNSDGIYKVISITHEGSIRGSNWYTNIICYTVGQERPAQIPFLVQ